MIYQLLRRDPLWEFVPYYVLGAAVLCPLLAESVQKVALAGMMIGFVPVFFGHQRAGRFQLGLPISGRQLFLTRQLTLLCILWLPALAGAATILTVRGASHAAAASAVLKLAALYTLAAAALQSVRVRDLGYPRWLMFTALPAIPLSARWVTESLGAAQVLGISLCLSAALLLRIWFIVPRSFQLAPAREVGRAVPAANVMRSATPAAWRPVFHTVFSWQYLVFAVMMFQGAMSGLWIIGSFWVGSVWMLVFRQRCRWLCALPMKARTLMLTIVAPILLVHAGGYILGLQVLKRRAPAPELSVQILTLAAILGWVLLILLTLALHDWRRVSRLGRWIRLLPALLLVGIPCVASSAFFLLAPSALTAQLMLVQRGVFQPLSRAIPGGPFGAAATAAAVLIPLSWALDRVFRESEFTGAARAPRTDFIE